MKIEVFADDVRPVAAFGFLGDPIVWVNGTDTPVSVYAGEFGPIDIPPGKESKPLRLDVEKKDGLSLRYRVFGKSIWVSGLLSLEQRVENLQLASLRDEFVPSYEREDWEALIEVAIAGWIFDVFDNIATNIEDPPQNSIPEVQLEEFKTLRRKLVESWPSGEAGHPFDPDNFSQLCNQRRSVLEPFARRCNLVWEYINLTARKVGRRPSELDGGLGTRGFAQNIKALGHPDKELRTAYQTQQSWMFKGLDIEIRKDWEVDLGTLPDVYSTRMAKVTLEQVRILRAHLEGGLRSSFRSDEFDRNAACEEIELLSRAGRWSTSEFSLWNWVRFCDVIVYGEQNGKLLDVRDMSERNRPGRPPWLPDHPRVP